MSKDYSQVAKTLRILYTVCGVVLLAGLAIYVAMQHDPTVYLKTYLEEVDPLIFFFLMVLLPVGGAPISIFLVLVGMKFGLVSALALSGLSMLAHMVMSYYLVDSFLEGWLSRLLKSLRMSIPSLKGENRYWHAFLFMLIPGLPYTMKNYALALAGVSFLPYILINWTAQFTMSIPLIVVGKGLIEMDPLILGAAGILLLSVYLLHYYLRKRARMLQQRKRPSPEE